VQIVTFTQKLVEPPAFRVAYKLAKVYWVGNDVPTVVSHLDMVVGLCTDDPKDF